MVELKGDLIIPTDNSSSVCFMSLSSACSMLLCAQLLRERQLYDNAFITVYIELLYQ